MAADEHLRLVVDASPSAMLLVAGDGRVVLANAEAEHSFGYSREEPAAGCAWRTWCRSGSGSTTTAPARSTSPTRRVAAWVWAASLYAVRKDGTEMRVEIGLNPITIGGERYVLASVIDITERLRGRRPRRPRPRTCCAAPSWTPSRSACSSSTAPGGSSPPTRPRSRSSATARTSLIGRWLTDIDAVERARYADGTPALSRVGADEAEWTYLHRDGYAVPVNEAIVPLPLGEEPGFIVVAYDIAHRIEDRERVEHLATHDGLTNLPNRSLLVRHLDRAFDCVDRSQRQVALLLLDLDHFKRINDSLGHHIGDEFARRRRRAAAGLGAPGRRGGPARWRRVRHRLRRPRPGHRPGRPARRVAVGGPGPDRGARLRAWR
ncbi:PAS domain S-box protein [Nocardioides sp. W3-2-3]|nr:PAS domain S-box protein [Nocardioides convexus]